MGQTNSNASSDRATARLTGTFAAAGQSGSVQVQATANLSIWGTLTATGLLIKLQKSYDFGTTWLDVSRDATGALMSFSTVSSTGISVQFTEPEMGVLYRLDCAGTTPSGTANYRISY